MDHSIRILGESKPMTRVLKRVSQPHRSIAPFLSWGNEGPARN